MECKNCKNEFNNVYEGTMPITVCGHCGNINHLIKDDECCLNPELVFIQYEKSNGVRSIRKACNNCKQTKSKEYKKSEHPNSNSYPCLFYLTRKEREDLYSNEWSKIHKLSAEIKAIFYSNDREERSALWWEEYDRHLQTDKWKSIRLAVLKRDNYVCQGCLNAKAYEVHHISYRNLGDELFFQLVSLCTPCHKKLHQK